MPSIKVVPPGDHSRQGYEQIQAGFGPGAPGALQIVAPTPAAHQAMTAVRRGPGHRPVPAAPAGPRRPGADRGDPRQRSLEPRAGHDDRSPALGASLRHVGRRLGSREPRPRGRAGGQDARGGRGGAGARLPAPAPRVPGARGGRDRRRAQPARDRRRLRDRQVDLPGRPPSRIARLPAAGLSGCLGAGVLLRDDLRDLDGLHGLPALLRQGAVGSRARRAQGDGRWPRPLGARDQRRRGRDGGRLLHLRPLGAPAPQGDGSDPRHRRAAGRLPGSAAARAGAAAPRGAGRLVSCRAGSVASCRTFASATAGRRPRETQPYLDGMRHRTCFPCATSRRARRAGQARVLSRRVRASSRRSGRGALRSHPREVHRRLRLRCARGDD